MYENLGFDEKNLRFAFKASRKLFSVITGAQLKQKEQKKFYQKEKNFEESQGESSQLL